MHRRMRHIERILQKRAQMYPVVGVLGPRQVGKSTFLMKQWAVVREAEYLTFDKKEVAARAKNSPEQLLLSESKNQTKHLIIDEAQKVPHIFDSIKALVDENRRVGAYTLSGSVEFSDKSGVRESLAGRMGITRLYPMTLRELSEESLATPWVDFDFSTPCVQAKTVEKWLLRGGMPIFTCFADHDERVESINNWLDAICYRDIMQLADGGYDSELAYGLLKAVAQNTGKIVSISYLEDEYGASAYYIKKHLDALQSLFLIYQFPSYENRNAHVMYRIFDAGVHHALLNSQLDSKSQQHNALVSLVINEIFAQYEYAGKRKPTLSYYLTRGGAKIDLVLTANDKVFGIDCVTSVDITDYKLRGMKSFLKKYPHAKGYVVAPVQKTYMIDDNITVVPWISVG